MTRYRLTTSINRLREHGACTGRFLHLLRALGYDAPGGTQRDLAAALNKLTPEQLAERINLRTILEHNGPYDCEWACCATFEDSAPARQAYAQATAQAWQAYAQAMAPAWQACAQAMAQAWQAYAQAMAPAQQACAQATAQAWQKILK